MSLKAKVTADLVAAMKAKDAKKLSILRVLKGEIERLGQNSTGKVDVTDGNIVALIKKLVEGIKESAKDEEEIVALEAYLPKQLTPEVMLELVVDLKASGLTNMGEFMKVFKTNHDGQYDGKVLSNIVKQVLA